MRNGNVLKMRVSKIRVKQIRANQGLGVFVYFQAAVSALFWLSQFCTPSPWLTRIRFTRISLTRIFKKFPFLT